MSTSRELAEQIEQLSKTVAACNKRRAVRYGTTTAQAKLLQVLARCGSCKMSDLGRGLQVTPRTVTKLVDRLEQEGLVTRAPHPRDRRATLIRATPSGLEIAARYASGPTDLEAALDQFPPAERAALRRLLEKLRRNLEIDDR